jgi:hypothetical protein
MTGAHGRRKQLKELISMKTTILSKILLSTGLMFVLGSAITQVRGDDPAIPTPGQLLVVTIHSSGDVTRGKTGSFVLSQSMSSDQPYIPYYPYINFSVSGTAIPGVDYVPIVSPARVGPDGYGVILVQTFSDPRGSSSRQAYSVVVTLDPGLGYAVGQPSSARMMINP